MDLLDAAYCHYLVGADRVGRGSTGFRINGTAIRFSFPYSTLINAAWQHIRHDVDAVRWMTNGIRNLV